MRTKKEIDAELLWRAKMIWQRRQVSRYQAWALILAIILGIIVFFNTVNNDRPEAFYQQTKETVL